jgi:hypothetical protein
MNSLRSRGGTQAAGAGWLLAAGCEKAVGNEGSDFSTANRQIVRGVFQSAIENRQSGTSQIGPTTTGAQAECLCH